ncbi:hydrogenase iron-sulfur subunit [candidate division CSSED10-310 bacterium]|uniref:Hydrogenase iron-sulfur subunit n=1 Tax=candidate division CSSED10-310 bacterium TaxID=2855610 RepID=A0ABV6Z150_UNCC1
MTSVNHGLQQNSEPLWQPKIVAFFCSWCTYTAADMAGVARLKYAPSIRIVRIMCSGRVDPQFVVTAFAQGADGVLIGGCHPGDCHYCEGNYKALRRYLLLKRMLHDMGIHEDRFRLEWISAAEGDKVRRVVNDMVAKVRNLGPLALPTRFREWDRELA